MGKDSRKGKRRKEEKEKPKESEFKKFVKKRAPIYLAVIALVAVFAVPELTKSDLQDHFPEDLTAGEKQALDTLMGYRGPDGGGLSVMDAISDTISEKYPGEKIYDSKKTSVDVQISSTGPDLYQVLLNFKSYKGEMDYSWDVDAGTGEISGNNPKAKHVVDLVDFYD